MEIGLQIVLVVGGATLLGYQLLRLRGGWSAIDNYPGLTAQLEKLFENGKLRRARKLLIACGHDSYCKVMLPAIESAIALRADAQAQSHKRIERRLSTACDDARDRQRVEDRKAAIAVYAGLLAWAAGVALGVVCFGVTPWTVYIVHTLPAALSALILARQRQNRTVPEHVNHLLPVLATAVIDTLDANNDPEAESAKARE